MFFVLEIGSEGFLNGFFFLADDVEEEFHLTDYQVQEALRRAIMAETDEDHLKQLLDVERWQVGYGSGNCSQLYRFCNWFCFCSATCTGRECRLFTVASSMGRQAGVTCGMKHWHTRYETFSEVTEDHLLWLSWTISSVRCLLLFRPQISDSHLFPSG